MSTVISLDAMQARAILYANLRDFFKSRQVGEVETAADRYSSDEQSTAVAAMQTLLEAGGGAVYQISKAFRDDVLDRRHLSEFSVMYWCQPAWSLEQALLDLTALFGAIFSGEIEPERRSYRQAFMSRLGFDPIDLSATELRQQARRLGLSQSFGDDRQGWLDTLFAHFIEPTLGLEMPLFMLDPLSHEHLAGQPIKLSDIYIDGIKVGSVSALGSIAIEDLPQISISLGIDRLLMIMLETRQIAKTLAVSKGSCN